MKKIIVIVGVVLSFALLAACAGNYMASAPMAKGDAVIAYITHDNPYQSWDLWPGKGKLYKGQKPHGAFLTTYVSKGALKALKNKSGMIPEGAMIVKENYSPAKKLAAITVMYKKKGYNPSGGDWYWLKYGPNGKVMKEGKVGGCINCHGSVKSNDWLFTGPVM